MCATPLDFLFAEFAVWAAARAVATFALVRCNGHQQRWHRNRETMTVARRKPIGQVYDPSVVV
jgi:hypothetical protein